MSDETDYFPWLNPNAHDGIMGFKTPEVKEEGQPDFSALFSPPSSPFITGTTPSVTSQPIRQRSTKSESPRARPYPELHRGSEDTIGMSGTSGSGYDIWSSRRGSSERRSSDGDNPLYQTGTYDSSNARGSAIHLSRSSSVSSSSLSGAVGSGSSGSHSRFASQSPRQSENNLSWHQQMPLSATSDLLYPGVAGDVPYLPSEPNYEGYASGASSSSTTYIYEQTIPTLPGYVPNGSPTLSSSNEDLHRRLEVLEYRHHRDREHINMLQAQMASLPSGYPTPASPSFEASWRARTDARIKQFCSLNRAGNALCAWHEPRREKRVYPPRTAPFGTLNCGCTYEQALFEESLSRHNVGSYLPGGDSVRMDPALRNALLRLLQERYNYRDGDFERDPVTGNWLPGEGPAYWEQQAATGRNPRRPQPARRDQDHR
jgi:hypothetical protein